MAGNLSEGCALDALMKQLQHEWAQPSPAAQVFRPAKARRRSSCHALHVPETTTVAPDIEYVNHTSYEAPLEMGVRPYLTWQAPLTPPRWYKGHPPRVPLEEWELSNFGRFQATCSLTQPAVRL